MSHLSSKSLAWDQAEYSEERDSRKKLEFVYFLFVRLIDGRSHTQSDSHQPEEWKKNRV